MTQPTIQKRRGRITVIDQYRSLDDYSDTTEGRFLALRRFETAWHHWTASAEYAASRFGGAPVCA